MAAKPKRKRYYLRCWSLSEWPLLYSNISRLRTL